MYVIIYIYIYISADLSIRASSVLDYTSLPTTSSPFHLPTLEAGPEEDIRPASPGGQAAEIEESYPPGTQAAGIQDLGARMLKSRNLIILSSSIGDLLRRNSAPQAATGRQHSGPKIQRMSSNRCSRGVPNS